MGLRLKTIQFKNHQLIKAKQCHLLGNAPGSKDEAAFTKKNARTSPRKENKITNSRVLFLRSNRESCSSP
jgi:hypothetical protein